jgi:hypothetical protein
LSEVEAATVPSEVDDVEVLWMKIR